MKRLFLCCCLLGAVPGVSVGDQPNLVLILADDLGYGDVHALNPERGKIPTPHLDRLAQQGMIFTDAHGGSSVCTPTRYGLLTGRYAWRTRLQSGVLDGYAAPLIAAQRLTLPALLREQGYHTAAMGKWHLGFTVQPAEHDPGVEKRGAAPVGAITTNGPTTRGFDEFHGFQHARSMSGFFENDRVTESIEPVDMLPKLAARASEYILRRAKRSAPFFLYLALNSPHTPIVPSREWEGKSGLGKYGDFVMETDWAVGQVLAALDKSGSAEKTLVVFASDNGCSPAAGTKTLEAAGHFASAQLRGYKSDIWEGGHRVPFLARWPGKIKAGSRCATTVSFTDLFATMAELTGAKIPSDAGEDSFSFLPDLLGTGRSVRVSVIHHSISGRFAIRAGDWKLEFCSGSGGWGEPQDNKATKQGLPALQLYNLKDDLGETNNVQAAHPDVVKRMTAQLESIIADGRSTPGSKQVNDVQVVPRKGVE